MRHHLSGIVIAGASDAPVQEASVSITAGPEPAPDIAALTDEAGRFSLPPLAAGRWTLQILAADGRSATVRVQIPIEGRHLVIRLPAARELITDEEG